MWRGTSDLVFIMWFKVVMDWRMWIMMRLMGFWMRRVVVYRVTLVRFWMKRMVVYMMTLVRFWMRFRLVAIDNMFMMLMKNTFRMIMVFMMFRTTNGSLTKLIGAWNRVGMVMRFMVKMSMINWW